MTRIRIGCQLPQEIIHFEKLVAIAQGCERLGCDSVWTYDHLAPFWREQGDSLECWTLLAAIAQRTHSIKIGTLVTNVNLRNPALLAKMATTVDIISGGRLILGLGTGDRLSRKELESHGYQFANLAERVERLKETVLILKSMWSRTEADTSFKGKYYRLTNAGNYPRPIQEPHPPIWIAGKHPTILDVVAELADGWNYWGIDINRSAELERYLAAKCKEFDRRYEDITRSTAWHVQGMLEGVKDRSAVLEELREELRNRTAHGTEYLIASLGPRAELLSYELFAEAAKGL